MKTKVEEAKELVRNHPLPPGLQTHSMYGGPVGGSDDPKILLLQDEFGEGNIHFWVEVEAANKHDFSECWMTCSGT